MSNPRYYFLKKGNEIYHYTEDGDGRDAVAIPPDTEVQFLIFHGSGGLKIDLQIGLRGPQNSGGSVARLDTNRLNFETNVGFGWELPLSPDLEINNPIQPPGGPGSGGGGGGNSRYTLEEMTVKLYRANEDDPVHTWNFNREEGFGMREFSYPVTSINGNPFIPDPNTMKKYGWWKCVISHKAPSAYIYFKSTSFLQPAVMKETLLDYRWLNHAFSTVMGAITPQAHINDEQVTVSVGTEVANAVGREGFSKTYHIDLIDQARFELGPISATAISGGMFKQFLTQELVRIKEEGIYAESEYEQVVENCARAQVEVKDEDVMIKILATFNKTFLRLNAAFVSIEALFDPKNQPHIFINLSPSTFKVYVNLHCKIALDLLDFAGITIQFPVDSTLRLINRYISEGIAENMELVEEFFRMGVGRAVAEYAFVESFRASAKGWHISYCETKKPDPSQQAHPLPGNQTHADLFNLNVTNATFHGNLVSPNQPVLENVPIESTPIDLALGELPQDFNVEPGVTLDRLDKLKTIVVIMMENRSFDHFLGNMCREIPLTNGDNYRGFPLDFSNPAQTNFVGPIKACKASSLDFYDGLVTPISPEHEHKHVMYQISDGQRDFDEPQNFGEMKGFTKDLMNRLENYPPHLVHPQMAMCYYGEKELPMYYFLAKNFKVLDHWFCSHPGPTWPNRIAMATGKLISKTNFNMSDSRLGFFKESTIFDTLTDYGIDWRYLESSVCILRLFDKYRTDITKLVPLQENDPYTITETNLGDDHLSGLELLLRQNTLPRVLFIDPRFSDVPPIKSANDDLAPANIGNGQKFIWEIYNKLFTSRHKNDIALVITYDEHGGFFDHVPPPGTPPSGITGIPKIHPEGPEFLGVRVPAFLICPYVDKHTVSHTIFDHTSIMKTILVHNRKKIPKDVFSQFSERLKKANHLGLALDRDTPREMTAAPVSLYERQPDPVEDIKEEIAYREAAGENQYDYVGSLQRLFLPR